MGGQMLRNFRFWLAMTLRKGRKIQSSRIIGQHSTEVGQ